MRVLWNEVVKWFQLCLGGVIRNKRGPISKNTEIGCIKKGICVNLETEITMITEDTIENSSVFLLLTYLTFPIHSDAMPSEGRCSSILHSERYCSCYNFTSENNCKSHFGNCQYLGLRTIDNIQHSFIREKKQANEKAINFYKTFFRGTPESSIAHGFSSHPFNR